ncbi:TPA: hypothetical protein I7148_20530 [Vibrio vulnificus]|nr:hypothetical protein [Vibrio vulnificus]
MKNQIFKSVKLDIILFIVSTIISLSTIPYYIYSLGVDGFGLYLSYQSVITILSATDIGLGVYLTHRLTAVVDSKKKIIVISKRTQFLQSIVVLIMFLVGFFVLTVLSIRGASWDSIIFVSFSLFALLVSTFFSLNKSVLRTYNHLNPIHYCIFINGGLAPLLGCIALYFGYGLPAIGIAIFISSCLSIGYLVIITKKLIGFCIIIPLPYHKAYLKRSFEYVKNFQMLKFCTVAKASALNVILLNLANASFVAKFNVMNKVPSMFNMLISRLLLNYFAKISMLYNSKRHRELQDEYENLLALALSLGFFMVISILTLNEKFVNIWVGDDMFMSGVSKYLILLIMFTMIINATTGLFIQSTGEFRRSSLVSLFELAVFFALSTTLGYIYNGEGVIFSFFVSSLVLTTYYYRVIKTIIDVSFCKILIDISKPLLFMSILTFTFSAVIAEAVESEIVSLSISIVAFLLVYVLTFYRHILLVIRD